MLSRVQLLPGQFSPWGDFVFVDQNSVNSSNHYLICSETVLTNSTSLSIKKSRWNLNHGLWNWWLFTRSFKMAVAPKPNEILRLANGGDNLHCVSRLLICGGAELLTADVHQLLFQQYVWGSAGEFTKKFTVGEKIRGTDLRTTIWCPIIPALTLSFFVGLSHDTLRTCSLPLNE